MFKFILLLTLYLPCVSMADSASPLFSLTLHDLNDKQVAMAKYKGKALIVNFWARWCAPCREEIPEFIRLQAVYRNKVDILGIGLEDDAAAVQGFASQYKINYPVLLAKNEGIPLMKALGNHRGGLPFTLAIDRHGKIVYSKLGLMRKADLEAAISLALQ